MSNTNATLEIIDKVCKDKKSKTLISDMLKTLESNYSKEIEKLSAEEKVALVIQIIGFEKSITELIKNGINYDKLLKIRKIIGK